MQSVSNNKNKSQGNKMGAIVSGKKKTTSNINNNVLFATIAIVATALILCCLLIAQAQAEHHEKHHKFHPYKYGYKVVDHKGNKQWKQEESHHPHEVKGSYGYKDKHGLFREVSYIADKHGFRAHVKTNEPGTAPKSSASVKMDAHPDPAAHKSHYGHEASHGHH